MLLGGSLTSNVNKLMLLANSNRCLLRQFTLIQHSRVCCVGRFVSVYSSTILSPNSCWNVVGHFVCNNTYWKTTAEILTHDFLVYGIYTIGENLRSLAPCRMASQRLEVLPSSCLPDANGFGDGFATHTVR